MKYVVAANFFNELVRDLGFWPTVIGFGVIALIVYSIVKGNKGNKYNQNGYNNQRGYNNRNNGFNNGGLHNPNNGNYQQQQYNNQQQQQYNNKNNGGMY